MKKLTTLLLISLCTLQVYSQTVKTEYYDPYAKTKVMAKYQVNSVGEKHGWFKGYDKEGVLIYEYNFKNNLWEGVNKEYSTYTGSRTLSQSETYKAGVLHGSAIYYAGTGSYKGRFIKAQGSYKDGKRDGEWIIMESFDAYGMPDEWKAKAQYIQFVKYYEKGKEVYPDGEIISYYLPSKQPSSVIIYKDGKETGEPKGYFPDGSIASEKMYDAEGKLLFETTYHPNGQLKGYVDWRSGKRVYEGYNEDGSPDKTMQYEQQKKEENERANAIGKANSTLNSDQVGEAIKMYQDLGINTEYLEFFLQLRIQFENKQINHSYFRSQLKTKYWDLVEKRAIQTMKAHEKYCEDYIERKTIEENKILEEKKQLNENVKSVLESYKSQNVTQVQTIMVDANGNAIMKDSYTKGRKYLYLKSMIVLDLYIQDFNNATDLIKKQDLAKKIKDAIDVLNKIPESEWKDLNKQLKKVDDPEQIKAILKI